MRAWWARIGVAPASRQARLTSARSGPILNRLLAAFESSSAPNRHR